MKNKKLFAILTLVCFMFTLMPVAAFAADYSDYYVEVKGAATTDKFDDSITVDVDETVTVKVMASKTTEASNMAIFAVDSDGVLDQITTEATISFDEVDTYKVYAADKNDVENIKALNVKKADKLELLMELDSLVDDYATVKVKASSLDYQIVLDGTYVKGNVKDGYTVSIDANNGWNAKGEITATLQKSSDDGDNWSDVKGADLTFTSAGYVTIITEDGKTTDRSGDVDFEVVSERAGKYTVYVKYGTKAKTELTVYVTAEEVNDVTLVNAPKAPIDVDQDVKNADIEFKFVDANGKAYDNLDVDDEDIVRITVTEKPADSTVEGSDFELVKEDTENGDPENDEDGVYTLAGEFDEEGEYTIKVTLKNGNSASVTVKVAEMGDITGIKFDVYNTARTIAYDATTQVNKVLAYDANGVTKALKVSDGMELSANGRAIKSFDASLGKVTTKDDTDYIGQTISVMAVYDGYVATTELTVVDKAATINYANLTAEVGVNTTLEGTVVDSEGKASSIAGQATTCSVLVLDKPANAVAVADATVNAKGKVLLNFLASEAGEYKVQTTVVYGSDSNYITSIDTITVGKGVGTFKDVVVMSIGSANVVVNSDVKAIDAAPMIKDGRTFVPFRALAEAFGATVAYDEATNSVTAELNGVKVVMTIGSTTYTVDGVAKTADVAPFINGSRTMVPVRFVAEAFGITVTPLYAADGSVADVLFAK